MRELGIFCSIGGGPTEIINKIWKKDEFSQKFNSLFNKKYNCKSYGSSLEFIGFGTTYISKNSRKKEEIIFSLEGKDFIYDIVLTEKELKEYLTEDISNVLIKSFEKGIAYMKTLDVGDFDVLKMESDIAKTLSEMGFNYVSVEVNKKLYNKSKFVINRSNDELEIMEQPDFMIKLYKNIEGALHYWETWNNDSESAIVHSGIVGLKGKINYIEPSSISNLRILVSDEIDKRISDGYKLLEDDEIYEIKIIFQIEEKNFKEDRKLQIEKRMNEILGWTGLGNVDHSKIHKGKIEVCCSVVDINLTKETIKKELKKLSGNQITFE